MIFSFSSFDRGESFARARKASISAISSSGEYRNCLASFLAVTRPSFSDFGTDAFGDKAFAPWGKVTMSLSQQFASKFIIKSSPSCHFIFHDKVTK